MKRDIRMLEMKLRQIKMGAIQSLSRSGNSAGLPPLDPKDEEMFVSIIQQCNQGLPEHEATSVAYQCHPDLEPITRPVQGLERSKEEQA